MAQSIEVYPTSDVHLIMGQSEQLTIRDAITLADISSHADTQYLNFDAAVVTVANGNFTPVATGESIGRVRHTDGTTVSEVLVRIRVHSDIQDIWMGNNQASVNQGSDNYVLTVYAKFDDETLGDISSHSYISWSSSDATKVSVSAEGRITGVVAGSNATITASYNALSTTVTAKVKPPYSQRRDILERIHGAGKYTNRKNILILGEGFTTGEKGFFDYLVQQVKQKLLDTNAQTPYDILSDDFNVWAAFEGMDEDGISIGNPVQNDGTPIPYTRAGGACNPSNDYTFKELIELVGLPDSSSPGNTADAQAQWNGTVSGFDPTRLSTTIFNAWHKQQIHGYAQARDSLLGLIAGGRFGDRSLSRDTTTPLKRFYLSSAPPRGITPDRRRLYNNWDRDQPLQEYIASLRIAGTTPADDNYDVNSVWLHNGADESLVCILAKDDFRCGTNFQQLAQTVGRSRKYKINKTGNKVDHTPQITQGTVNAPPMVSVVAHEFAHSMDLGDEYEGYDNPSHQRIDLTNSAAKNRIANFSNLTHFENVQLGADPNKIDPSKIKWVLPRINKLSTIVNAAQNQAGNKIKVELRSGEASKWNAIQAAGTEIFLRNPDINKNRVNSKFYVVGPLTIDSISGDEIILSGGQVTAPGTLPAKSQLYEPLRDSGTILNTIDEHVLAHLNSTNRPFGEKADCSRCVYEPAYPDSGISGFTYPRFRYETVGIYEGGGTYNCDVFRSNGAAKMRYSHSFEITQETILGITIHYVNPKVRQARFSFVAKYVIVNMINPEKLPNINALYPQP